MILYIGIKSKHLSMDTLEVFSIAGLIQDITIEMVLINDRRKKEWHSSKR